MPEVTKRINIHNRFDVHKRKAWETESENRQIAFAENIILDALWTHTFGTTPSYYYGQYVHIGTGTGTLSASRTSLFNFLVAKTNGSQTFDVDVSEGWASCRRSAVLNPEDNVGAVITEVGLATTDTSTSLKTHALLKDMNGNTVSITKSDTDIITIYNTVYLVFPSAGFESGGILTPMHFRPNIPLSVPAGSYRDVVYGWLFGTNYSRPSYIGDEYNSVWFSEMYAPFQYYMPALISDGIFSNENYQGIRPTVTKDAANKRVSFYARLPAQYMNYPNGVKSVGLCVPFYNVPSGAAFFADLTNSDVFSGSVIVGESVGTGDGTNKDFRTAFPLLKTGTVTVKIDGVADSNVTIDLDRPPTTNLTPFLKPISSTESAQSTMPLLPSISSVTSKFYQNELVFENTVYQTVGMASIKLTKGVLYCSDDGSTWSQSVDNSSHNSGLGPALKSIPAGDQGKRYWKFVAVASSIQGIRDAVCNEADVTNIHLTNAPANGAVVTVDYESKVMAKDANHVFDFTFTIQLGEYTP